MPKIKSITSSPSQQEDHLQSSVLVPVTKFLSLQFISQMKRKLIEYKQSDEKQYEGPLDICLQKINFYINTAHSFLFDDADQLCSCAGAHSVCLCGKKAEDLDIAWKDSHKNVPKCCVERYILRGYVTAHQPYSYYFKILWTATNETFNVWTHLLPAFYFMLLFYFYNETIDSWHAWPLLITVLSSVAITLCSAIAHLFHSRSSYHHCCWFLLDYFGITLYAFSSMIAHFFACSEVSYYKRIGWINLPIFMIIGVIGYYCCCYSKTCNDGTTYHRRWKIISNAFGYFYGMIPILHRLATRDTEDPAMFYHMLQLLFMLLSPLLYGADFPEKWWPGKFDIIGHSHQLFHISIAFACYFDIVAVHIDIQSESWKLLTKQIDYPSLHDVVVQAVLLVFFCALVTLHFVREFRLCYKEEIDGLSGQIGHKNANKILKLDTSESKKCQ